jgi:hypothetical protein
LLIKDKTPAGNPQGFMKNIFEKLFLLIEQKSCGGGVKRVFTGNTPPNVFLWIAKGI